MARPARPGARQALLEAARLEFARAGLHGARVEDMTRRAGLSKGAFYLHFRSKEEAFRELLQRLLGALEASADRREAAAARLDGAAIARGARGEAARMEAQCALDVDLLELLWSNRQLLAAVERGGAERWGPVVAEFRQRQRAATADRLRARQAAGLVRTEVDASVAADLVMGAFEDFGRRMAALRAKPDLEAWARSFRTILQQGLMTRRSARPARRTS